MSVAKENVLKQACKSIDAWRAYIDTLSRSDAEQAEAVLADSVEEFERTLSHLGYCRAIARGRMEKLKKEEEEADRKRRREGSRLCLRRFLGTPELPIDMPLAQLPLCTTSGATALLEGLFFDGQLVNSVNEAKRLFQAGAQCTARWKLHYAKDGQITAPFGWDRPFLDELFVLPYGAPK
jgi:hypothetical protein